MDILNTKDFNKLSMEEIKVLVNKVNTLANQQIKELEDTGYYALSQAYRSLQNRQGRDKPFFSTNLEGLTKGQLYNRYVASTSYLTLKTSNVEGTRDTNIDIYKNMGYSQEQATKIVDKLASESLGGDNIETPNKSSDNTSNDGYIDMRYFWKNYRHLEQLGYTQQYESNFLQAKLKTYMSQTGSNDIDIDDFNNFILSKYYEEKREEEEQEQEENERLWGENIEDEI